LKTSIKKKKKTPVTKKAKAKVSEKGKSKKKADDESSKKKVEKKPKAKPKAKKLEKKVKKIEELVDEEEENAEEEEGNEEVDKKKRFFKCIYNDPNEGEYVEFGRYSGSKPLQSAKKALTTIIRDIEGGNEACYGREFSFAIKECTQKSKRKTKYYRGTKSLSASIPVPVNKILTDDDGNILYEKR